MLTQAQNKSGPAPLSQVSICNLEFWGLKKGLLILQAIKSLSTFLDTQYQQRHKAEQFKDYK